MDRAVFLLLAGAAVLVAVEASGEERCPPCEVKCNSEATPPYDQWEWQYHNVSTNCTCSCFIPTDQQLMSCPMDCGIRFEEQDDASLRCRCAPTPEHYWDCSRKNCQNTCPPGEIPVLDQYGCDICSCDKYNNRTRWAFGCPTAPCDGRLVFHQDPTGGRNCLCLDD